MSQFYCLISLYMLSMRQFETNNIFICALFQMSKMLVDLRIENNKLKERAAQDNFELKNKVC